MPYLVSETNRTPNIQQQQYVSYMIVAATAAVGPVHVSFVSNPWAHVILTKDTFEYSGVYNTSNLFLFIELNSIRLGGNIYT